MKQNTDILVIGSGAAGLTASLELAKDFKVTLISKETFVDSSTWYAQGGIAAVLAENDTTESHIKDTLIAGDGLCDEKAVRFCIENGKSAIKWLIDSGVSFTKNESGSDYHLTKEGGHSHRRVIHAADTTGKEVSDSLAAKVLKDKNITILENHLAVDLITEDQVCKGAYVFDKEREQVITISASSTILATGGASKIYLYTSNPDGASGDGFALAWRAGCTLSNMEFNQFHPTCLYHPEAKSFLISEALRGEGAKLINHENKEFMKNYDSREELAPRDVVSRSIDEEMKKTGKDCVYLDISHKSEKEIKKSFPAIHTKCLEFGFDITKTSIPVVPAAHYTCGGVKTDLKGRTNIDSLYVIGETSCTGLHGANRMASNSLLECVVFAKSAADDIKINFVPNSHNLSNWDNSKVIRAGENIVISHNWDATRRLMWDYVGVVRSDDRLKKAKEKIKLIHDEVEDFYRNYEISSDFIELRNLVLVARIVIESASRRFESRGLHFTSDYPEKSDQAIPSLISNKDLNY
ncbi:L-aspartate oxidase [SAR86 cluster bacterium]|jgi:L-aspartate oxidase|nr:L-aspartate oxidase [SAR86 cluster bacterium]